MSEDLALGIDTDDWTCVALAQGFQLPRGTTLGQLEALADAWLDFKRAHRKDRAIWPIEAWIPGGFDLIDRKDESASNWGVERIYLGRGMAYGRIGSYPSAINKKSLQKARRGFKEIPAAIVEFLGAQLGATGSDLR